MFRTTDPPGPLFEPGWQRLVDVRDRRGGGGRGLRGTRTLLAVDRVPEGGLSRFAVTDQDIRPDQGTGPSGSGTGQGSTRVTWVGNPVSGTRFNT